MHMATRTSLGMFVASAILLWTAGPARSQEVDRNVVIGFVLQEAGAPLRCGDLQPLSCSSEEAVVSGSLFQEYYALLCAFGGDEERGIAGLALGVDYNGAAQTGVDVLEWTLCASLEFPSDTWPEPRSGNIITWEYQSECQLTVPGDPAEGVTAIAGWFRVSAYSTDRFSVIQHTKTQQNPFLKYADCGGGESSGAEYLLDPDTQAGSLGFSDNLSEKGKLPCFRRVEEETTWGRIKSTYGH